MKPLGILVLLIIIHCPRCCLGQEVMITDTGRIYNAKLVILSEWHLQEFLPPYKCKLIEKLYREEELTDLVLETGKAAAYLLNEYVATGDTGILRSFPLFTQQSRDYLKQFRLYKLPSGRPVKIHGVDFERMTIVPALMRVLLKTGHTDNELYRYLTGLPDTLGYLSKYDMMISERSAVVQKCISIYKLNAAYYGAIYDDGYIVKEICENPALETEWDKRFDAMAHNLQMLYRNNESRKYLLIVGMFHVDCPNPIYRELEQKYRLEEEDIVNIVLVVKDCVAEAMYQGRGHVRLATSKDILYQPGLVDSLYRLYSRPCMYQLVDVRSRFPDYRPSFKCDYILPIDCKFDNVACE